MRAKPGWIWTNESGEHLESPGVKVGHRWLWSDWKCWTAAQSSCWWDYTATSQEIYISFFRNILFFFLFYCIKINDPDGSNGMVQGCFSFKIIIGGTVILESQVYSCPCYQQLISLGELVSDSVYVWRFGDVWSVTLNAKQPWLHLNLELLKIDWTSSFLMTAELAFEG